ncbi:Gvp36p [Sugiyamaella lignohabitans]|uniref:Gvp36p n=1 Tax=Sugiyamaella lignohabitans TaxID=796027 RepID=A0A167FN62_9ASCO|nr:Gvp36p [Sugiyamaella lignohabitans]ANB15503.1 Gvp36p [Sugiyamaella lignohabitans]
MSGFDFNKSFQSLQGSVSGISQSFTPFAKRTTRLIQERLGNAEDKTELPEEYLELERRIDALKLVHQKLLSVTSQYENEGYDYPPNLRESFVDLSRTISEKVTTLSHAQSAQEAQNILTSPGSQKEPKTLNHALGRAALAGSESLSSSSDSQPLANALQKYAVAEEKIGEARLSQDQLIVTRFNAAFTTTLNTSIQFATKARRNVQNARLTLDAAKASAKVAKPEKQAAAQIEVEHAEDEFVAATEEAVSVMKNVLDTPEPLRNLLELITAQLAFHKAASEILGDLLPEIETLQSEQESTYRKSRETS